MNYVTITGTFYIGTGSEVGQGAGSALFTASDILWDSTSFFVAMLAPVNAPINANGTFPTDATAPQLLAMDNAGISGNWNWLCQLQINGTTWPVRKLTINYAAGATQDISVLLGASTLA
jgi:hypothetical protein